LPHLSGHSGPRPARRVARLAAALVLVAAAPAALAASAPAEQATKVVEGFHDVLLGAMKRADELGYQGRYEKLAPAVRQTFDLDFMAEKSVGRHWRSWDEASRRRWREAFVQHTVASYAGRFDGYSGQHFETEGAEPAAHETILVRTRLVLPEDEDVRLNYRLRQASQGWQVVDVYLNGTVSELALRRSEYSSVLQREGFETLVAHLDEKVEDLRSGETTE